MMKAFASCVVAQGLSEEHQAQLLKGVLQYVPETLFQDVFQARQKIDGERKATSKEKRETKKTWAGCLQTVVTFAVYPADAR